MKICVTGVFQADLSGKTHKLCRLPLTFRWCPVKGRERFAVTHISISPECLNSYPEQLSLVHRACWLSRFELSWNIRVRSSSFPYHRLILCTPIVLNSVYRPFHTLPEAKYFANCFLV